MHVRSSSPGKPEQADWQAKTAHHGRIQAVFWSDGPASALLVAFAMFLAESEPVYENYGCGTKNNAEADAEEGEAGEAGGEVVDALEDNGEGVEEAEENGEVESRVQTEEKDNRLCKNHFDWSREGHGQ